MGEEKKEKKVKELPLDQIIIIIMEKGADSFFQCLCIPSWRQENPLAPRSHTESQPLLTWFFGEIVWQAMCGVGGLCAACSLHVYACKGRKVEKNWQVLKLNMECSYLAIFLHLRTMHTL